MKNDNTAETARFLVVMLLLIARRYLLVEWCEGDVIAGACCCHDNAVVVVAVSSNDWHRLNADDDDDNKDDDGGDCVYILPPSLRPPPPPAARRDSSTDRDLVAVTLGEHALLGHVGSYSYAAMFSLFFTTSVAHPATITTQSHTDHPRAANSNISCRKKNSQWFCCQLHSSSSSSYTRQHRQHNDGKRPQNCC